MTKLIDMQQGELVVIQQDGLALRFVETQTPELCLAAMQQAGLALYYVKTQTPEICLAAVQQNGLALDYIKIQTLELCLAAVQQTGWALGYVNNPTPEICLAAVQQNPGVEQKLSQHQAALLEQARILSRLAELTVQPVITARKRIGINI